MEKISKYVSYKEVTYSSTAIKHNIDNSPDDVQLANIKLCAEKVFDPLREWVNGQVMITSCFRSVALNKRIGGENSSQHLANNGAAFDIDDTFCHKSNKEMFFHVLDKLDFDQLIWEYGTDDNPNWIHASYKKTENRKEVLRAKKINDLTVYIMLSASELEKLR